LGIRARRFGATGAPRGGELVVSTTRTGDQLEPDVAARADRWAVVWTEYPMHEDRPARGVRT
jgi:hypothetical protein